MGLRKTIRILSAARHVLLRWVLSNINDYHIFRISDF